MPPIQLLIPALLLCIACGNSAKLSPGHDAGHSGGDAGNSGASSAGGSGGGAGQHTGGSSGIDPTPAKPCVQVEAIPDPPDNQPWGRVFSVNNQNITLISGADQQLAPDGGVFSFSQANGWLRLSDLDIPPLAGASKAAAIKTEYEAFENLVVVASEIGGQFKSGICTGDIWKTEASTWNATFGSCGNAKSAQLIRSIDPFISRYLIAEKEFHAVVENSTIYPDIEGWNPEHFHIFQRFTPNGSLFLRSGMAKPISVLDILGSKNTLVDGAQPLEAFATTASDGDKVWVYGYNQTGTPRLYLIDLSLAKAKAFSTQGLPLPSKPYVAQDILVAENSRLWVARFAQGEALIATRAGENTQAHTLSGDIQAALELFEPIEIDINDYPYLNGFFPPENLVAFPWAEGRILVARQFGAPKAILLSLCED